MAEDVRQTIMTPVIRMNYPVLAVPRKYKNNGKEQGDPKYQLGMIVDPADMDKFKIEKDGKLEEVNIEKLLQGLAKQKWPTMKLAEMFPKKPSGGRDWPLKSGDELIALNAKLDKPKKLDHLAGKTLINTTANDKVPPMLSYYDEKKRAYVTLDRDNPDDLKKIKKLFESGSYAMCEVNVVPQIVSDKCFMTFYLNHVRFVRTGERIGGGGSMMDRFGGVDGGSGEYGGSDDGFGSDDDFGGDDEGI